MAFPFPECPAAQAASARPAGDPGHVPGDGGRGGELAAGGAHPGHRARLHGGAGPAPAGAAAGPPEGDG